MNAFILAGGHSSRMGRDKALLEMDGRPLIEHMLAKLLKLGLHPRICGSRPDLARFADTVPDNFAHCGPLAGIEAALAIADSDLNLFVPVDLPGIPGEFLDWLVLRAEGSHAVATVPRYVDRAQPLCAVYSRRLLDGIRGCLSARNSKVTTAIRGSARSLGESVDEFDVESVAGTGPAGWPTGTRPADWFRNVNTLSDYEALLAASGAKRDDPISWGQT